MRRYWHFAVFALVALGAAMLPAHQGAAKPNDTIVTGFCVTGPADASGPLAGNPYVVQGYMPKEPYGYGVPYGAEQGALQPQYADKANYYHLHAEFRKELMPHF